MLNSDRISEYLIKKLGVRFPVKQSTNRFNPYGITHRWQIEHINNRNRLIEQINIVANLRNLLSE